MGGLPSSESIELYIPCIYLWHLCCPLAAISLFFSLILYLPYFCSSSVVWIFRPLARIYLCLYCFGAQRSYSSLSLGSKQLTMVGSDLIMVFFRGVPSIEEEGLDRIGIRVVCAGEEIVDVGDPKVELFRLAADP